MTKLQKYAAIISIVAGTLAIGGFLWDRFLSDGLPDLSGDQKIPQDVRACVKAARQVADLPSLRYFAKGDDNWTRTDALTREVRACVQGGPLEKGGRRVKTAAQAYGLAMQAVHLRITKTDGGQIQHTEASPELAKFLEKCRSSLKAAYRVLAACVQQRYRDKKGGRCSDDGYTAVTGDSDCDVPRNSWPVFPK